MEHGQPVCHLLLFVLKHSAGTFSAVRGTTIFQLNLRPNWALGHQFGSDALSGDQSTEYQRLACNSPRGLSASLQPPLAVFARPAFARLWRFGAPMLNYHSWFRRREPCLSINYTCKRITNWQNQTISSKSGRETLKRRPRRKKRGSASASPPIHLRLRWKRSKLGHSSVCKKLYVKLRG
jgi:hypothetical protein